jgi:hypothetical protein
MARFKELCGLSLIHSVIDVTLIHLQKPKGEIFVEMIIIHSNPKVTTFRCKQWLITIRVFVTSLLTFPAW